jgi:hypothetical protein
LRKIWHVLTKNVRFVARFDPPLHITTEYKSHHT